MILSQISIYAEPVRCPGSAWPVSENSLAETASETGLKLNAEPMIGCLARFAAFRADWVRATDIRIASRRDGHSPQRNGVAACLQSLILLVASASFIASQASWSHLTIRRCVN